MQASTVSHANSDHLLCLEGHPASSNIATEAFIRVCSLVCAYVLINLIVAVTKKCESSTVICFNFYNTKYEVAAKIQREIVEVNRE